MVNDSFFCNAIDQQITMVQGDTMSFNFQLVGLGGVANGVKFSINNSPSNRQSTITLCTLNNGISLLNYDSETDTATYCVRLAPSKTGSGRTWLDNEAQWVYDLEITKGTDILTLMRGRFIMLDSIS